MWSPFVAAVIRSYRWWKEGQLEARWGGEVPEAIARGIDVYDVALKSVQAHDLRVQAERDRVENETPPDGPMRGPRGARRPFRRRVF